MSSSIGVGVLVQQNLWKTGAVVRSLRSYRFFSHSWRQKLGQPAHCTSTSQRLPPTIKQRMRPCPAAAPPGPVHGASSHSQSQSQRKRGVPLPRHRRGVNKSRTTHRPLRPAAATSLPRSLSFLFPLPFLSASESNTYAENNGRVRILRKERDR